MAIITDLMELVSDEIDGASLALPVETTRGFVNVIKVDDLEDLRVVVLPEQMEINGSTLKPRAAVDWGVRIWVQKPVEYETQATEVPTLFALCEDIALLFKPGVVIREDAAWYRSIGVQIRPAYNPKLLDESGVFESQIVAVFRLTRE